MHQALWQLQTAKRVKPVSLSQRSDPILQVYRSYIDAGPSDAYDFYQQTLENMVLGAETDSTITAKIELMPRERSSACVQLLVVACLLEPFSFCFTSRCEGSINSRLANPSTHRGAEGSCGRRRDGGPNFIPGQPKRVPKRRYTRRVPCSRLRG